jgi:hypothetical protein
MASMASRPNLGFFGQNGKNKELDLLLYRIVAIQLVIEKYRNQSDWTSKRK